MPSNLCLSYSWIHWTRPSGPPMPIPEGIERFFVKTPEGNLEVLHANPPTPTLKSPIVFTHGAMGSATMWIPYMRYLASNGVTSYSVSTRGHGASWYPTFLRMSYCTTKRMLGDDLLACINEVEKREGSQVVLVGHSGGGGLSQFLVNKGTKVKALALLAPISGNGS